MHNHNKSQSSSKEHRRPQFKIEPNSAREHDRSASAGHRAPNTTSYLQMLNNYTPTQMQSAEKKQTTIQGNPEDHSSMYNKMY